MDGISIYREITVRYKIIGEPHESTQLVFRTLSRKARCANALRIVTVYAIGIGLIVFGARNVDHCPAQKMIPICLIILGSMFLFSRLLNILYDYRSVFGSEIDVKVPVFLFWINLICSLARFCVFITLCYLIFSADQIPDAEEHDLPHYCESTFYVITSWGCIVTLIYIVLTWFALFFQFISGP